MNQKKDNKQVRIIRLLELIEGVNKSIKNSQKINNDLMVRQYLHLKIKYIKELLSVLAEYDIAVQSAEAA